MTTTGRQPGSANGRETNKIGKLRGLDALDRAILTELTRDPFASNRAVADAIGENLSTVTSRLRTLDRRKVSHVIAVMDLARMGQSFCFVLIEVRQRSVDEVSEEIAALRQVLMVSDLADGAADLLVLVRFDSPTSLNEMLYGCLAAIRGVSRWEISIVVDIPVFRAEYVTFTDNFFPTDLEKNLTDLEQDLPAEVGDQIDRTLVAHLQQNAHQSINDIARKTGMNPSTVRYRINNLEASGIIRFIRIIDHTAVGIGAFALIQLDVDIQKVRQVVTALRDRSWLPQLFVCAGKQTVLGIILARDEREIIRIKREELGPIAGIYEIRVSRLLRTRKIDFRWAQRTA